MKAGRHKIHGGSNKTNIVRSSILGDVHTGPVINIRQAKRSVRPKEYPEGSIGRNLPLRNYIKYLIERYHRFREADASYGPVPARFSYAVIFKNIERRFKAPTYFIAEERFEELVAFLEQRINATRQGKRNRANDIANYVAFDEFVREQSGSPSPR